MFLQLEIDGKEPADGAIIYHDKKHEVGIITAATCRLLLKILL